MNHLPTNIREYLGLLKSQDNREAKDIFRKIFCKLLGFSYTSEKKDISYFPVALQEVLDEVEVIAKTEPSDGTPFFIIYISAKKITKTLRHLLIKKLLDFTDAITLEFANFISIIRTDNVWHIVAPLYRKEIEKVVLRIYTVGYGEKHRTVAEALAKLKIPRPHPSALEIKDLVDEAMYIRPLTEEFFEDYKKYYGLIHEYIVKNYDKKFAEKYKGKLPNNIFVHRAAKSFAHSLLNKLMFIYFLQKKGWLGNKKDFIRWLWETYENDEEENKEFYRDYLRPLLLEAMNKPRNLRKFNGLPKEVKKIFMDIPYFNGGLFSHLYEENVNVDKIVTSIPDSLMKEVIFGFLEEYNFTVTEESPYEIEIAVDPAMLGHIYESLIAEQERNASGIFYTPRAEVDLMCRLALFEYLSNFTENREELLKFIFKPPSSYSGPVDRRWINALDNVTIVDPACGSGAFLIGAFQVIRELYEKAGISTDFERKREIIRKNLYGVDIKEWAVRVAELRMWLALIEDENQMPTAEPMLPNLNVNLKVGDALVPEVEIDGKKSILPKSFLEKWKNYFKNEKYKEIAEKIFDGLIDRSILEKNKKEMFRKAVDELYKDVIIVQSTFTGDLVELNRFSSEEKEIIKQLHKAKTVKVPFLWELDFPEIFTRGGFDIVISNPPYVRQESIYPEYLDLNEFEMLSTEERNRLKSDYKKQVIKTTEDVATNILKMNFNLSKRSDLYAYFFIHSLNLLKEKGTLVYITSNSWLDVDYGTKLQEFFLRACELKYVIDNVKRSFEQADINTVITVLKRKKKGDINVTIESCVNFVMLKIPFEETTYHDIVSFTKPYCGSLHKKVNVFGGILYLYENNRVRVRSVTTVDLCKIGEVTSEEIIHTQETKRLGIRSYKGSKWGGLFLKSPDIFYKILTKYGNKFVKLGDIADIISVSWSRQGQNSILMVHKQSYKKEENIEVIDVFKSPKDVSTIMVNKTDTKYYLRLLPTIRNQIVYSPILWVDLRGDKHICHYCKDRVAFTHNFHGIIPIKFKSEILVLILNSTLIWLFIEVLGRKSLGGGAIRILVDDLKTLFPVPNPEIIARNKIKNILNKIAFREIKPIFEELGLPKPNKDYSNINPEDIKLENIMPDRRELDKIIFESLGLTEEEQLDVYKAVVELVKQRLTKARSV